MGFGPNQTSEDDVVALAIRDDSGAIAHVINTWKSYSYGSNFLTPTDAWSFTLGDEALAAPIIKKLARGTRVTLSINGHIQGDGLVDRVKISSSRDSGTSITVEGRDRLGQVVDGHVDPVKTQISAGQTLFDVLYTVFAPYGWTDQDTQYLVSNETNRNVITGATKGAPTTKKGKPLKSYVTHQLKPYPNEGAFAFAARIAQRFGQWIWVTSEGNSLVISTPDFDQPARFTITHPKGIGGAIAGPGFVGLSNVISSEVTKDVTEQPSIILASASGGGGEFSRVGLKAAIINEITGLDADGRMRPEVLAVLRDHPDAHIVGPFVDKVLEGVAQGTLLRSTAREPGAPFKALFLNDDESKTLEQLEAFVRREMALKQQQALRCTYTFDGHTNNGFPWCVNCIADVDDDVSDVHEQMWILSRTFTKSRDAGTSTTVELIRPNTLVF